ncbi:Pal1 cell morphology protein-domain-containing protein [Xylaria nigripes]|nr:Pal1 cell morphology protein-domain-containing protein [Xylaria nigripes]
MMLFAAFIGHPSGQHSDDPSARLAINLSSNNPFRNRAASPNTVGAPLRSPFDDPPPRPTSRNPFLDPAYTYSSGSQLVTSPEKMSQPTGAQSATTEELFENLDIQDGTSKKAQPRPNGGQSSSSRPSRGPPRGENIPPQGRGPSISHRPTRSQEEALKGRRMQSGPNETKRTGVSPQRRPDPRQRRNSDSSVMEKPITDEERKLREIRQRDREKRHRDGKSSRPRKIDIIDQLDATSIYGTGLFHHDGPFDACNPHRNRKGSRRAPMQAFAKDSANNTIGGSGPLNSRADHTLFMGQEIHDASTMYGNRDLMKPKAHEMELFDPKQRGEYEHGEETLGLGSSTFLEGTPAARTAIARNQEESAQEAAELGLARKKSVVQRFKSIKRGPKDYNELGRVTSPDSYHNPRPSFPAVSTTSDRTPFFSEYDIEDQGSFQRKDSDAMSPLSPLSPPVHNSGLERRATTDATMDSLTDGQGKPPAGGFLSRVKSLKGARRQRPEPPSKEGVPGYGPGCAL